MQLVVRRVIYRVFRKPRKNVIDLGNELARTTGDVMWRTWNFDECSIDAADLEGAVQLLRLR